MLSVEYIAGLYDGDGSFVVSLIKRSSIPVGFQIQFEIILNISSNDKDVFNQIINTLKDVNFTIYDQKSVGQSQLRIRGVHNCLTFLKKIKPYIRLPSNIVRLSIYEEMLKLAIHDDVYRLPTFKEFLKLLAEYRKYSKRCIGLTRFDIERILKNIDSLDRSLISLLMYRPSKADKRELIEKLKNVKVEDFSLHYLSGLIDADGYFGISLKRDRRLAFGYQVLPLFNLNLAMYEMNFLIKLREKLKTLNPNIKTMERNNTAYFQITGAYNVKQLIEMIEDKIHLPSMKKRVSLVKQVIELILRSSPITQREWNQIIILINELRKLSKRRRSQK